MDGQAGVTWGFIWNPAVAMAGLGSLGHIHRHKGDSVVQGFACHVPKHLVHPLSPSASRHPRRSTPVYPTHPFTAPCPPQLHTRPSFLRCFKQWLCSQADAGWSLVASVLLCDPSCVSEHQFPHLSIKGDATDLKLH